MVGLSGIFVAWTMESILELGIFLGFLYWAFPGLFSVGLTRVNKMVDIVTNRVFDTYNRFSPLNNNQKDSLATLTTLKRFSKDQKYKRALTREADTKARETQLFHIKEHAPDVQVARKRPFMGLSCQNCALTSRESLVSKTTESLALRNILNHKLSTHPNGFLQKTFSHLYQVHELKKYDYPQVADIVLCDDRVKTAVEKMTIQQFQDAESVDEEFYQKLLKSNERRAKKLLYDMRSTLSDFLLRFTSWVLYKLLPCFLTSVVAHPGQVEMLKKASESSLPLIFLPLHRSHLDYILISFILLNNNIRSPLVAAGDNLKIPFFGSLLRGLGAFFIKRRIDPVQGRKDLIYKTVLHSYLSTCLRAGHNVEFFLEGGRTRTGKPCMPKYGVLSVIIETFMDGTIEDALLVPVSVNYERLVDGNFIREQLGQPKAMETFGSAVKAIWNVLNSNYGMMRIDFNQPFSLRIAHNQLPVMSTNALAFLLLTKYREGATIEILVRALDDLRKELEYSGRDLGFTGDSIDVINYAFDILGPTLVHKEKHVDSYIIKPIAVLPNIIELAYYSNMLVTHFALDSVVAIAIGTLDTSSGSVVHQDVVETVLELCEVLQYEFMLCKPCQSLEQVVTSCIEELVHRKQIFLVCEEEDTELTRRSRRIAQQFEENDVDGDEGDFSQKIYKVNPNKSAIDTLNSLRLPLMPLMEAYSVTAFTLDKLVGRQLLEAELIGDVLKEIKSQLVLGTVKFEESVSVDPIKNALKLFQKWGILECHTEKKLRLYYLKESQDDSDAMKALYQRVDKFRQFR